MPRPPLRKKMPRWKLDKARDMRKNPTPAEAHLWEKLKSNKIIGKVRRQALIRGFIADFYSPSHSLVIECDGCYHVKRMDDRRDRIMNELGITVLRFSNREILDNVWRVLNVIKKAVK